MVHISLLLLLLQQSLLPQILLIAGQTRRSCCCCSGGRGSWHTLLPQLLLQASPLLQLLLQKLQLLLLHALVKAYLLELLRRHANVAVPLAMLLVRLRHIVVLFGGAVAVAAAAAVAGRPSSGNMLPVAVAVGVAVVLAIDAGPGAGGTALGNVYESHDVGEQQQQHLVARTEAAPLLPVIFGQSAADQRCDVAKSSPLSLWFFLVPLFLVLVSFRFFLSFLYFF